MAKKATSIRGQLLLMTIIVLTVINGVAIWTANLYANRAAKLSYDRLIHGAALQIAENTNLLDQRVVIDLPVSAFETLALAPSDKAFYGITLADGTLLTGYGDLPQSNQPSPVTDASDEVMPVYYDASYKGEKVRFITLSKRLIEADDSRVVNITLGQTTLARNQLASEMGGLVMQFLVGFFVITLGLLMFGIWRVLRPLKFLKRAIEARSSTELTPLDSNVPSEIRPLLETMNYFMSQLNTTLERLKRFTSEAAHQLRTPLAGLNLQAQNALIEQDAAVREKQLEDIIRSSRLLSETVNHLLEEASITHRFRSQSFAPVELGEMAKEVSRDLVVWALESDVEIEYWSDIQASIKGDRVALTQMLRNIIENAVKYSPPSSVVKVTLCYVDEDICLAVEDQGIGIPDEEKPHVFERFYRSQHNQTVGTGIGLSIAKEVAEHHSARFVLENNHPQGLIIKVLFNAPEVAL